MSAAARPEGAHHFCRWFLPGGEQQQDAAAYFPGSTPAEAAHAIDGFSPRQLRDLFASIFGATTTSNNTSWMRQKLKTALGLGGKKQRQRSAGVASRGRKRTHQGAGSGPLGCQRQGLSPPALRYPSAMAHGFRPSPEPPSHSLPPAAPLDALPSPLGLPWGAAAAAAAGGAAAHEGGSASASASVMDSGSGSQGGDPFRRSPSSDWESCTHYGGPPVPPPGRPWAHQRSFADGADALLAAAAEVDRAAAEEAAQAAEAAVAAAAAAAAAAASAAPTRALTPVPAPLSQPVAAPDGMPPAGAGAGAAASPATTPGSAAPVRASSGAGPLLPPAHTACLFAGQRCQQVGPLLTTAPPPATQPPPLPLPLQQQQLAQSAQATVMRLLAAMVAAPRGQGQGRTHPTPPSPTSTDM